MHERGCITWNTEQLNGSTQKKAFGFISREDGMMYSFTLSNQGEGFKTLEEGQAVTFDVEDSDRGPQAVNVTKD